MFRRIFWVAALCAASLAPVWADEVQVGTKERLSGTILGMSGGKLRFVSESIGEIQINWALVTDLRSEQSLALYAEGGKVIVGVIAGMEGPLLQVQTPEGVQSVDSAQVLRISTELPRGEKPQPVTVWKGTARLGFGYTTGNTTRQEFLVGAEAHRRGAMSELVISAQTERGETNDRRDLARAAAKLGYARNQGPRTFLSLDSSIEHDDIRQLRLRGSYALSTGFRLSDTPAARWRLQFGANYTHASFRTQSDNEVTMRVESLGEWLVWGRSRLTVGVVAFPSVERLKHLRTAADVSVSFPLTAAIDLTLSATDEFDSHPPAGVRKNDLRTRTSLGYRF